MTQCKEKCARLNEEILKYHSSGSYEAFAHPRKPEEVVEKSTYLVGGGLA